MMKSPNRPFLDVEECQVYLDQLLDLTRLVGGDQFFRRGQRRGHRKI
jgi:hypothetical protein